MANLVDYYSILNDLRGKMTAKAACDTLLAWVSGKLLAGKENYPLAEGVLYDFVNRVAEVAEFDHRNVIEVKRDIEKHLIKWCVKKNVIAQNEDSSHSTLHLDATLCDFLQSILPVMHDHKTCYKVISEYHTNFDNINTFFSTGIHASKEKTLTALLSGMPLTTARIDILTPTRLSRHLDNAPLFQLMQFINSHNHTLELRYSNQPCYIESLCQFALKSDLSSLHPDAFLSLALSNQCHVFDDAFQQITSLYMQDDEQEMPQFQDLKSLLRYFDETASLRVAPHLLGGYDMGDAHPELNAQNMISELLRSFYRHAHDYVLLDATCDNSLNSYDQMKEIKAKPALVLEQILSFFRESSTANPKPISYALEMHGNNTRYHINTTLSAFDGLPKNNVISMIANLISLIDSKEQKALLVDVGKVMPFSFLTDLILNEKPAAEITRHLLCGVRFGIYPDHQYHYLHIHSCEKLIKAVIESYGPYFDGLSVLNSIASKPVKTHLKQYTALLTAGFNGTKDDNAIAPALLKLA